MKEVNFSISVSFPSLETTGSKNAAVRQEESFRINDNYLRIKIMRDKRMK